MFDAQKENFLKYVQGHAIVIPVIQRDYAQGRKSSKPTQIRKRFVHDLVSFLADAEGKSHDLDFVYGRVNDDEFVPIDGQQRLTTLFLLHLYVASKSGHFEEFNKCLKIGEEYRFRYQTRESSKRFCENLIEKNIYGEENEAEISEKKKPSDQIKNQNWFYETWLCDPTVDGMLVMLDAIDEEFDERKDITIEKAYDRLFVNTDVPAITFWLMPLEGFSRSDDLYIKMNARGVYLTNTEIFKASFEDFLENIEYEKKDKFKENIDGKWTDYFWSCRTKFGCENGVDEILENLIRVMILCSYRVHSKVDAKAEYRMGACRLLQGEKDKEKISFSFFDYCNSKFEHGRTKETFEIPLSVFHTRESKVDSEQIKNEKFIVENIFSCFDLLCDDNKSPLSGKNICAKEWFDVDSVLTRILYKDLSKIKVPAPSLSELTLFYAYVRYCASREKDIELNDLNDWVLLVRNIDIKTHCHDVDAIVRAAMDIDKMLDSLGQQSVVEWLSDMDAERLNEIEYFERTAFKEECIKAQILKFEGSREQKPSKMQALIERCNKNHYMQGQMGFILLFSGWYDKYDAGLLLSIDDVCYEEFCSSALKFVNVAEAIFSDFKPKKNECGEIVAECLLERALLASEEELCLLKTNAPRYNFANQLYEENYSWLDLFKVDLNQKNRNILNAVKSLFNKIDSNDVVASLKQIIANPVQNQKWRSILYGNKEFISYCSQGFFYVEKYEMLQDEFPKILLFAQSQMNHYHSELFSKELYSRKKEEMDFIKYEEVKSKDENAGMMFKFDYDDDRYKCLLYFDGCCWKFEISNCDGKDVPSAVADLKKYEKISDGDKFVNEIVDDIKRLPGKFVYDEK